MADLSNLLGDVYGEPTPEPQPAAAEAPTTDTDDDAALDPAPVPAWADETRLDEVFADWVPQGPDPVLGGDDPRATPVQPSGTGPAPLDDDLAAALSAALAEAPRPAATPDPLPRMPDPESPAPPPVVDVTTLEPVLDDDFDTGPVTEVAAPVPVAWQRTDDDILPLRSRGKKSRSLRLR